MDLICSGVVQIFMKNIILAILIAMALSAPSCAAGEKTLAGSGKPGSGGSAPPPASAADARKTFADSLVDAAMDRLKANVVYDPKYYRISYPGGDVPSDRGVCTDVVIRSYRKLGVDLQKEVHEDMKANFEKYPKKWGLSKTDTNIDHRRVPNLQTFFKRKGKSLPVTKNPKDYLPGDLVTWLLPGNLPHIGIVVSEFADESRGRRMIVHNVGAGPDMEDALFSWEITGHYRYHPE